MGDRKTRISNIDTLSALCDRLSIENHKVAFFENKKREEQKKFSAYRDNTLIALWDDASRDACELRAEIKKRIDDLFLEVIETKEYNYKREVRTFSPTPRVSEYLDKVYEDYANSAVKGELAEAFLQELNGKD